MLGVAAIVAKCQSEGVLKVPGTAQPENLLASLRRCREALQKSFEQLHRAGLPVGNLLVNVQYILDSFELTNQFYFALPEYPFAGRFI